MKRVFVTGAGIVSAAGSGVEETLEALKSGRTGVRKIKHISTALSDLPVGEVKLSNAEMSQMLNLDYPHSELRTVLMGIMAAREAVHSANLSTEQLKKSAFISGTTVGGMDMTERHFNAVWESQGESGEEKELKYNDCGFSSSLIADAVGRFRMVTTPSTACSSAANAIILGANLIKAGVVDIVVAGGSEALSKFHINGFNSLMILDSDVCRPFDRDRSGINLGEGAAYIVLESEESAKKRNAKILAELSGYGNSCDAFHQTASSQNGEGPFLSMSKALEMSGLSPEKIDYINAHGTGTPNNDETELEAMRRIWGDRIPPFSSTKPLTGHTTSAAGAIEAVISLLVLRNGFIPANRGWKNPISGNISPVTDMTDNTEINNVVSNSFGFGGNDSTLIFTRYEE